jgi:hypothetical protein
MAGNTRPPSTIQRPGAIRDPQPGRRNTIRNSTSTSANKIAEPASITHHSPAIDAAEGPDGASVDKGPAQPLSAASGARVVSGASGARVANGNAVLNRPWTRLRKKL